MIVVVIMRETEPPKIFAEEEILLKCGCGSTFFDRTDMVNHLAFGHGATP